VKKPYLSPSLVNVLKASFFHSMGDLGYKFSDEYKSSLEGREKLELPIAMVALAATGVSYASSLPYSF